MRVCQSAFLVLLLLVLPVVSGCGTIHSFIDNIIGLGKKPLPTIKAIPVWQRIPSRFVSYDEAGGFVPHGFFDLVPFVSVKQRKVNFVMTTPVAGKFRYSLDFASGFLYRQHRYCSRDDMAGKYSGSLYRPPYTEGFVPRLLDQMGMPQQIVVFGDKYHLISFDKTVDRSQRVRVVGGILKEYCQRHPCRDKSWRSATVLIAVNPMDKDFQNVREIKDLKEVVDWDHALAFMSNSEGHHHFGESSTRQYESKGSFRPRPPWNRPSLKAIFLPLKN